MTSWSDAVLASAVPTRGSGVSRLNRLNNLFRPVPVGVVREERNCRLSADFAGPFTRR
ncbi:protein of unknown function [Bradyrhizobium vignae]|uniref:Uncharacterized protein n=1 Tax=Bradyrhizobium vignae TaxID=1549949 RepID=A0A2U3PYY7_9BRAD|nr:protein of unknown function [Bradyrhizobium vignae]